MVNRKPFFNIKNMAKKTKCSKKIRSDKILIFFFQWMFPPVRLKREQIIMWEGYVQNDYILLKNNYLFIFSWINNKK